jgi:NADH-quinone oxidoreductase subunit E
MTAKTTRQSIVEDLSEPIAEIVKRYPKRRSAIMPALYLAQEKYGCIDETTYQAISQILDVPEIWVFELASFYTLYNRKEIGKYHLQLCTNVPCMLRGTYDLMEHLQSRLGIKNGETSKDGLFTLTAVECIGSCDVAPAMMINQSYHNNLSKEQLDKILDGLSQAENVL